MATVKLVRRLSNPARKRSRRVSKARKNPALVLTLGAVNPTTKRRVKMSRRSNPRRRRSRRAPLINFIAPISRRRNRRRRRRNPVVRTTRHYRRRYGRRRNPLFPGVTLTQVLGGLLGVAATRFIGALIPMQITNFAGNASPLVKDLIAGALVAWGGSKMGSGEIKGDLAKGVSFGALMQVASTGVQVFVPALRTYGIGINGLGYMVPANFPVPQNPLGAPALPPAAGVAGRGRVTTSGIQRAFGTAL